MRFYPGVLEFLKPQDALPTTALLEFDDAKPSRRWEGLRVGRQIQTPPAARRLSLQTLDGERYRIEAQAPEPQATPATQPAAPASAVLACLPDGLAQAQAQARWLKEKGTDTDIADDRGPVGEQAAKPVCCACGRAPPPTIGGTGLTPRTKPPAACCWWPKTPSRPWPAAATPASSACG